MARGDICACGSELVVRRMKGTGLFLCVSCRAIHRRKQRKGVVCTNYEDAKAAYEKNRRYHTCRGNLPAYDILAEELGTDPAAYSVLGKKYGLSASGMWRVNKQYFERVLPKQFSRKTTRRLYDREMRRSQLAEIRQRFQVDRRFFRLRRALKVRRLRLEPVFLYEHGKITGYSKYRVTVEGLVCAYYYTRKIQRKKNRVCWVLAVRSKEVFSADLLIFDLVDQLNQSDLIFAPPERMPAAWRDRLNVVATVPVEGRTTNTGKEQGRPPLFDWCLYKDRFDVLQAAIDRGKKKMAKATLPLRKEAAQGLA